MMDCKSCRSPMCDMRGKLEVTCYGYQPMTNADYIRSMSDEELVELIECPYGMQCPVGHGTCGDCTLEWLKQPKENVKLGEHFKSSESEKFPKIKRRTR